MTTPPRASLAEMWTEGTRVLLRWIGFSFVLGLVSLPFSVAYQYVFHRFVVERGAAGKVVFIAIVLVYIAVAPFVLYAVSEWTGEFVAPRITRKRLRLGPRSVMPGKQG